MRRFVAPAAFGLAAALAVPTLAEAAPRKTFDESEGFTDPRKRELPRRHRFRLTLASHYVRLSTGVSEDGETSQRFHHAPLMLNVAYQVQFLKRLMFRPALGVGPNVANTRNAMPLSIAPEAVLGYQGTMFGLGAKYSFIWNVPARQDATDGRADSIGQPTLLNNHFAGGELSFTSRIDRIALTFAAGAGGVRGVWTHFGESNLRWRPMFFFQGGVFFDGTIRRARRAKRFSDGKTQRRNR